MCVPPGFHLDPAPPRYDELLNGTHPHHAAVVGRLVELDGPAASLVAESSVSRLGARIGDGDVDSAVAPSPMTTHAAHGRPAGPGTVKPYRGRLRT